MNRRNFIHFLGTSTVGGSAVSHAIAQRTESAENHPSLRFLNRKTGAHGFRASERAKRPNIFLITLDMVSPDHYHPSRALLRHMDLPAIRSLFQDGVFFSNAFCASPLCAPARAALATGRYTYITANGERAHDGHETVLRPADVIFQEYLKASGYQTKHAGKGHLGTQKFIDAFGENDNAWDRWAPPTYDDEQYLLHLQRLGVKPQRYKKQIRTLQQDRRSPLVDVGGWIEQSDGKPFPVEAQYSQFLARRAVEKLNTALAGENAARPVYLQLDFFDPHQPFSIPDGFGEHERRLRPACDELPATYQKVRARNWEPFPNEPKVYELYRKNWGLYDPATMRDYRLGNALQMEVVDRAIGAFLDELRRRGLYDEAIIILTSDHGEMNGRHALADKGVYLYPDVLRVPLVVKMPRSSGVTRNTVEAPVTHLDVAPTLLEIAGVEPLERLDGESLMPHLKGTSASRDRDLFFECGWHTGVNFACGTQRWMPGGQHLLYSYNISSRYDELYDLRSTDAENLAREPEYKRQRSEMVARLGAILERDPRWMCYAGSFGIDHYFDLPKPTGDVQMFRPR